LCSNHSVRGVPGLSPHQSRLQSITTPSPSSQPEAAEFPFLNLRESPPLFRPSPPRSLRGSSLLSLSRSHRDPSRSSPDPRLSNLSPLDLSQSRPDPRLSHLGLSQSRLALSQSKPDLRLLQPGPRLLLSSSLDSSQSPSQLEDRGQLPSQPSLAELPEPDLSRDLSWESLLSFRPSSLSSLSLTADSSPDPRVSLSSDRLRFSLLSSDRLRSNLAS